MEVSKRDKRELRRLKEGGVGGEPIPVLAIETSAAGIAPVEEPDEPGAGLNLGKGATGPAPDPDAASSQEAHRPVTVVDLDKSVAEPMPDLTPLAAETENQGGAEEELRKKYERVIEIGIQQFIESVQKKIGWAESKGLDKREKLLEYGVDLDEFEFGRSDDRQRYTEHAFQEIAQRLGAGEKIEHVQNVAKAVAERIEKESGSELGKFIILIEKLQAEEKEAKKSGVAPQPVSAPAAAAPLPPDNIHVVEDVEGQAEENYFNPEQREELEDFVETIRQYREGLLVNIENFGEQKYWMVPEDIDNNIIPYARKIYFENFSGHAGLTEKDMDEAVGYALEKIIETK